MTRLVQVTVSSYNPDKEPKNTRRDTTIPVNTLINNLAGAIYNVVASIPNTPIIHHSRPINKIKDLSAAIQSLSMDDIEPFSVEFPYSAGTQKTYRVIKEVK